MRKKEIVAVRVDPLTWDKLQEIADEKKVTRSSLVDAVLRSYVHRYFLKRGQADHKKSD